MFERPLRFDDAFLEPLARAAASKRAKEAVAEARQKFLREADTGVQGWFDLPEDKHALATIKALMRTMRHAKTLLVLGIGGSDLGTRVMMEALHPKKQVVFAGANVDPDALSETLSGLDWKQTCVNVVSKSGETLETMTSFLVAREWMRKRGGKDWRSRVVATTSRKGLLRDLAEAEGYRTLPMADNVSGRFSVLSAVGLFPAAWAGLPVEEILAGARLQSRLLEQWDTDAFSLRLAFWYLAALDAGRNEWVLMPYADRLETFADWYRQLVAETLGKKGKGPTPLAALGARDQHSQLQLYMQGPKNKILTFMEIERFENTVKVPVQKTTVAALRRLGGRSLAELIHMERRATAEALHGAGAPSGTLFLPRLDGHALGQLFQGWMIAIALVAHARGLNPYDQPGVEAGKKIVRRWLEK